MKKDKTTIRERILTTLGLAGIVIGAAAAAGALIGLCWLGYFAGFKM